jgi:hypothetical protein
MEKHREIMAREAALMLGKRMDDTYKLLQGGQLRGRKVYGRWLVSLASVEEYKRRSKARTRGRRVRVSSPVAAQAAAPEAATAQSA